MVTAGNTRQQATDIPLTPQSRSLSGQLTAHDRHDFYRFSFTVPRSLNLSLPGIRSRAGANVSLLNFAGKRLLSFDDKDLQQKNRVTLDTGTYLLRVFRSHGNTNYRLKLAAPLHIDRAGNTFDTARRLNLSQNPTISKDFVSLSSDPIDTYSFQLTQDAVLSGFVAGQISAVPAQIFDSQGRSIAALTAKLTELRCAAGTYYLQIQPRSRATGYSLSLSQTPYFDQAGDTLDTGRWISLDSDSDRYTDFVSRSIDSADYYRFDLSAKSTKFSADLKGDRSQDVELELRSNGAAIDLSNDDETILAAGTYFVRVRPQSDQLTRYTLELAGLPIADGGGDSRATATRFDRVFFGNASFTLQDFVGVGDRVDYYKLLVAERLNLRLSSPQTIAVLDGEPAQLQYDLITDTGVQISLNTLSLNNVGVNLSPGTYYLRVAAVSGSATYTLPVRLRYLQLGGIVGGIV